MSSRSDSSSDSSDSEDLSTTGLIATRQKRSTAGNLYATLRANLDDEELQKELLAEDEEGDAGDYEASDKENGGGDGDEEDEALESSSEDEDAGPPKEGEAEDLDGEKALKRQERAEAKKKRLKGRDARMKLPASWQKRKPIKRVQLADDAKPSDDSAADSAATPRERPRKKSERVNWMPSAADAPVRQSARALAVANREIVHANLKQSAERSEKQRKVMKHAAEREGGKRARMMELGQAERLKKCEKIERETAREFGRWEREEAERERQREEALAAKRKRGLEGPYVRWWSGSVLWEGERVKVRRVSHGSRKVEEIAMKEEKKDEPKEEEEQGVDALEAFKKGELVGEDSKQAGSDVVMQEHPPQQQDADGTTAQPAAQPAVENAPATSASTQDTPVQPPVPWLQGIQEYAAQPTTNTAPTEPLMNGYTPSAPAINGILPPQNQLPPAAFQPPPYPLHHQPPPPQMYHGWPPGSHEFPLQSYPYQPSHPQPPPQQTAVPPPPPPAPLLREQAQRTLLILTAFPSLDIPNPPTTGPTKRGPKPAASTATHPTGALKSHLLPPQGPPLTAEQTKYLTTKPRKRTNLPEHPLPAPPPRARCALTSWPAKFRDPGTGVAYADMHQFRALRRVLGGGCKWSAGLGAWVGPEAGYKGGLGVGRAARGVPEGFTGVKVESESAVEG